MGEETTPLNGEAAQYDMWDAIDSAYHEAVAEALDQLQEKGLITEIKTMPSDREHHDNDCPSHTDGYEWALQNAGVR